MKKIPLFILLLMFGVFAQAQNISVKSFKYLENDMDARVHYPKKDLNGEVCAIIKVVTPETGFSWDVGTLGVVSAERKTGEYWLYVPWGVKAITIKHDKLGVLRNYVLPVPVQKACVYELVLVTAKIKTIVEEVEIPTQWVIITSEPSGANVYINDQHKGTTPFQGELEEGKYNYRIQKPLYKNKAGSFDLVEADGKKKLDFTLDPDFGFIQVNTTPESGAKVTIDGQPLSSGTPVKSDRLKTGNYKVKVTKEMYHPQEKEVTVISGQTVDVSFNLLPTFGGITLNTLPEQGASVILNGNPTNKTTPCTLEKLSSGTHDITFQKEWFEPQTKRITIAEGESQTINVDLKPTFGTLKLTTEPNAKIYIDNEFKASDKWEGRLIAGWHTIEARKEKHTTDKKKLEIVVAKEHNLSLHPTAQVGDLKVVTNPFDATIYLNGENKGTTPQNIKGLLVGDYSVRLEKSGYGTLTKTLTIKENETVEINETLPSGKEITITSNPAGAALYIEGSKVGTTPYTATLGFGSHAVKLINGKKIVENSISVIQGGKTKFEFNMAEKLVDKRDGQEYKIVTIGNQVWMAENLNYKTSSGSWCYDDKSHNCDQYGRLYNWETAKRVCPDGWHLPSKSEFETLLNNYGGEGNGAYVALKQGGSSGFSALFGGWRYTSGDYGGIGRIGYFWSSSPHGNDRAWGLGMYYNLRADMYDRQP